MMELELDVIRRITASNDDVPGNLQELLAFTLSAESVSGRWAISVVLVDDLELQELHARFMGINEPTDVMTFPDDVNNVTGGDIIISVERAAENGPLHGKETGEEIAFLAVHGVLHLCGWRDADQDSRNAMLARQQGIIDSFGTGSSRFS